MVRNPFIRASLISLFIFVTIFSSSIADAAAPLWSTGNLYSTISNGTSGGDLPGTWAIGGSDIQGQHTWNGSVSFDTQGVATSGAIADSNGSSYTITSGNFGTTPTGLTRGSLEDSDGIITQFTMQMDGNKEILAGEGNATGNEDGFFIFMKESSNISISDLTGTWFFGGSDLQGNHTWDGIVTLDNSGNVSSGTINGSTGTSYTLSSGNFDISSTGAVTGFFTDSDGVTTQFTMQMNGQKSIIAGEGNEDGVFIFIKQSSGRSTQELEGTWFFGGSDLQANHTWDGIVTIDASGSLSNGYSASSSGELYNLTSGNFATTASGKTSGSFTNSDGVTTQFTLHLDQNKGIMAGEGNASSNDDGLFVFVRIIDIDGDGVADTSDPFPTDPRYKLDTDGDGMADEWETARFGNLNQTAGGDPDQDGLTNLQEFVNETLPLRQDTDGDGMPDGYEVTQGLNLTMNDANGDLDQNGISNLDEYIASMGTIISGRVTNNLGQGLPGVWVDALSQSLDAAFGAATSQDGLYTINVPRTDDFKVSVWSQSGFQTMHFDNAADWDDAQLVDTSQGPVVGIDFSLSAGVELGGTVTGLGSGEILHIALWSDTTLGWGAVSLTGTGSPLPYTISGLTPAADYRLHAWSETAAGGYLQSDDSLGLYEAAVLLTAPSHAVNLSLTAGVSISGTISGVSQGDVINISATSESTGSWSSQSLLSSGETASYTLNGLAPGNDYRLAVSAEKYLFGYYGGTPGAAPVSWREAAPIDASNNISSIDLTLTAGRSISGTISGLSAGDTAFVNVWSNATETGGSTKVTGTGANLPYLISGLAHASDYKAAITADGYQGGFFSGTGLTAAPLADLLDTTTSNLTGIDFSLGHGNSLSGTISGLGKEEYAFLDAWSESAWYWAGIYLKGTGSDITYLFDGLPAADDYRVTFRPAYHASATKTAIDSSPNPTHINFVCQDDRSISGSLSGAIANSVVKIEAGSVSSGDWTSMSVKTDQNGTAQYTLAGLGPNADYVVSASNQGAKIFYDLQTGTTILSDATEIDLSNADQTGIDLDFADLSPRSITGSITGLAAGRTVWIDAWDPSTWYWNGVERVGNGTFSVTLVPGIFNLAIYASGYQDAWYDGDNSLTTNASAAAGIDINAASRDVGSLEMVTGHSLSGTIYDKNGQPLPGVFVQVSAANFSRGTTSLPDGSYAIAGLAGNTTYTVELFSRHGNYSGQVEIAESNLSGQDITLGAVNANTGAISGTVTSSASSVMVILTRGTTFVNAIYTDASGQFYFGGLTPGDYTVSVDDGADGSIDAPPCTQTVEENTTQTCPITLP